MAQAGAVRRPTPNSALWHWRRRHAKRFVQCRRGRQGAPAGVFQQALKWEEQLYNIDISGDGTLYGQEVCFWWAPPARRCRGTAIPIPPTAAISSARDPQGLAGCLQNLANPAPVDWVQFANAGRDTVLFFMLYWMNIVHYPSPVLVNEGEHWVVVGWETDIEPTAGSSPNCSRSSISIPSPIMSAPTRR